MTLPRLDPALEWLRDALTELRTAAATLTLPLELPGREDAYRQAAALVAHIDGFLLPRLGRVGAPLLAVIGGSTGAGKSTLINSIARAPVSPAGVLRPTTRAPVIACHPADAAFFGGPGLPAVLRPGHPIHHSRVLDWTGHGPPKAIVAQGLTPGMALLDAPDIDSLVASNRELAMRLFDAADLWVFVTTAARYADAAPWRFLATARDRGVAMIVILNRVPPEAQTDLAAHLAEMLADHGLPDVPYFVLPETQLDRGGMLPETAVGSVRDWLAGIARDPEAAATVTRQTLDGALAALDLTSRRLARAANTQAMAVHHLDIKVREAHDRAAKAIRRALKDGSLLRGEVLARWRALAQTDPQSLIAAVLQTVEAAAVAASQEAIDETRAAWSESAAGRQLLAGNQVEPLDDAEPLVARWLRCVERAAGRFRRLPKEKAIAAVATRSLGPDDSPEFTGHEYATILSAMADTADRCHNELATAVEEALEAQANRYHDQLHVLGVSAEAADTLMLAAHRVTHAERANAP